MRQHWILAVAAAAAVGAAAPAEASAQGASQSVRAGQQAQPQQARTQQQRERARAAEQRQREQARAAEQQQRERARAAEQRQRDAERARRAERDRYEQRDGRYDDRLGQQQRGHGPPFCRDGSGHPVHGRQWCRDKGWGLGVQWDRARWEDVVLRQPRDRKRQLNRGGLIDVLGDVVLGRFEAQGRRHGSGPLAGTWLQDGNAGVLQLSVGGVPFARLVDSNHNGRVDAVLLRR
jgi:hypothetical protein